MYTGAYVAPKEKQKEVIHNQNLEELEPGMMVALDYEAYTERPLIGEVKEVKKDTILIVWYGGSWSSKWQIAKKNKGRKKVEWLEEVPKDTVVLFDFSLTNKGKLRGATVRALRESYKRSSENEED